MQSTDIQRIDFRVVIALCGGNIDTTVLGRCLDRGLAADGRLVKFSVTVSDRPGGIAELARTLAKLGVTIKDMVHERAWIKNDIFSVEVLVVVETRDSEHAAEMVRVLKDNYKKLSFTGHGGALGIDIGDEEDDDDVEDDTHAESLTVPGSGMRRRSLSRRRLSIATTTFT